MDKGTVEVLGGNGTLVASLSTDPKSGQRRREHRHSGRGGGLRAVSDRSGHDGVEPGSCVPPMRSRRNARTAPAAWRKVRHPDRSEEHTSELQSLMRISYAVFCLKQ